jgi:hypothetical protein
MATRREILVRGGLAAAVTASLGLLAASGEPTAPPQARTAALAPAGAEAAASNSPPQRREALRMDLLQRGAQEKAAQDVFAAHSWQRAAPPAPEPRLEPPPAPPPTAPPPPFTFLGTFEAADGKPVFYLVEGDQVHAVGEGEVINGVWRVEAAGVDEIVLLYLPLSIRQSLALGTAK